MSIGGPVHWHEGLFLQPHHLQTLQRHVAERESVSRRLERSHAYGMVVAQLAPDALARSVVEFDELRAIMPSGLVVDVPTGAALPGLDIKERFAAARRGLTILLGVPLWSGDRANVIDPERGDVRDRRLYRIEEVGVADENTGTNVQPLPIRRVNARLMFEDDDRTDVETLPLMRLVAAAGDSPIPVQDPGFMPPCYAIRGSVVLRDLARELAGAIEANRRETVVQMTRGGFDADAMRAPELRTMLRLRSLSRAASILPSMLAGTATSPFDIWLILRELQAELAGLQPDRDEFDVPDYLHDDPALCFLDLADRLRSLLKPVGGSRFRRIELVKDGPIYAGTLADGDVDDANEMYLGVRTSMDPRELAALVEDEDGFKLMAKSMWRNRIRGVRLTEERHPPVHLPAEGGLHYFRLMRDESRRMWDRVVEERDVAVWWPEAENVDWSLALYLTTIDGN